VDCGAFYEVAFCEPSSSIAVGTFSYSLNVEVTGAARLYRAASVLTAGLCVVPFGDEYFNYFNYSFCLEHNAKVNHLLVNRNIFFARWYR